MGIRLHGPSSKKPSLKSLKSLKMPKKIGGFSPLALGLTVAGVAGAGYLLLREGTAHAQTGPAIVPTPTPAPPAPRKPVNPTPAPPGTANQPLVAGQTATVAAPNGLHLRNGPSASAGDLGKLAQGAVVLVLDASRADGWVQVQTPTEDGFMCNTCAELNANQGGTPIPQGLVPGGEGGGGTGTREPGES